MRLNDYMLSSDADKEKWLDTFKITTGLKYFGGKSITGKYLMNHIYNMAVKMAKDGKKADIFVDGFCGGGKIGLSVPEGWFDKIVVNDLDYGVTSYFQCCKEHPSALIKMIEELGKYMDKDMFTFLAYNRSRWESLSEPEKLEKREEYQPFVSKEKVEPLTAAAMTYWVTEADFFGCTDPSSVSYSLGIADNKNNNVAGRNEKERINNIIRLSKKRIPEICKLMNRNNIIVEHLDYREVIKKYNGKPYMDVEGKEHPAEAEYEGLNKLWYFDPPYHPAALSGGEPAPYEDTFTLDMTREMVTILHNDNVDVYGELQYFIKSDYNPKNAYEDFLNNLNYAETRKKGAPKESYEYYNNYIDRMTKQISASKDAYHDFDALEQNDKHSSNYETESEKIEYYVVFIGEFNKGAYDDSKEERSKGREYIWCRGNYQGDILDWEYNVE